MLNNYKPSQNRHALRKATLLYPEVFRELCINFLDIHDCNHGGGYKELSMLTHDNERLEQTLDYLGDEIIANGGQIPDHEDCLWACSKEERPKILRFIKLKGGTPWKN